jgi:hypothetical protein
VGARFSCDVGFSSAAFEVVRDLMKPRLRHRIGGAHPPRRLQVLADAMESITSSEDTGPSRPDLAREIEMLWAHGSTCCGRASGGSGNLRRRAIVYFLAVLLGLDPISAWPGNLQHESYPRAGDRKAGRVRGLSPS